MPDADTLFDKVYNNALNEFYQFDINSDEATASVKNLKVLSECRPPSVEPEPEPTPEPTTVLGKVKAGFHGVWDNETTRVLIKAGGAFAGVALVTWTTVHRDHVVTREALSQANLRNV
jgi:hypothetical protein